MLIVCMNYYCLCLRQWGARVRWYFRVRARWYFILIFVWNFWDFKTSLITCKVTCTVLLESLDENRTSLDYVLYKDSVHSVWRCCLMFCKKVSVGHKMAGQRCTFPQIIHLGWFLICCSTASLKITLILNGGFSPCWTPITRPLVLLQHRTAWESYAAGCLHEKTALLRETCSGPFELRNRSVKY